MARWCEIEAAEPELAQAARDLFDRNKHKVLATLRRDGSPRVSGIETEFTDGDVWLGMMPGSRKARDLRRDPRLALHTAVMMPPDDPSGWPGDAKLAGRAVEVIDPAVLARFVADNSPPDFHLFRIDITELVVTRVGEPADHLVIDAWHEGRGRRQLTRR
ncbi:MAG: pyridoxamine 5'-phosphate oxidase family protein [Dactylosporangium sp.]|nr:pyridoxamine 5'-phosphate oxidase family protein [Dactylosporangium sp.]